MPNGLLVGCDEVVSKWAFDKFHIFQMPVNAAIGVVNEDGNLVGAILFQNFNGVNVELSYYGPRTLSYGIIRTIARIAVSNFNAARLTVVTSKRNKGLSKALLKLGFKLEGTSRCYYGHQDVPRNTGVRFVMFKQRLDELSK